MSEETHIPPEGMDAEADADTGVAMSTDAEEEALTEDENDVQQPTAATFTLPRPPRQPRQTGPGRPKYVEDMLPEHRVSLGLNAMLQCPSSLSTADNKKHSNEIYRLLSEG